MYFTFAAAFTLVTGILTRIHGCHCQTEKIPDLEQLTRQSSAEFHSNEVLQLQPQLSSELDPMIQVPSVILQPSGGIGNQLFMYASTYTIARQLNTTLFIQLPSEMESSTSRKFTTNERKYALDQFNITRNPNLVKYLPTSAEIPSGLCFKFNELNIFKGQLPSDKILIANDYWESELFFEPYKSELRAQFSLTVDTAGIESLLRDVSSSESVSVHVRRGDFARYGPNNRTLPFSYVLRAMELLESAPTLKNVSLKYFIFSDNINYAMKQFQARPEFTRFRSIVYVSTPNRTSLQEFYLMTRCTHAIISNSTFSWWAAYLNRSRSPNKVVIAPFPKHRQRFYDAYLSPEVRKFKELLGWKYSYPKSWITINPYESFYDSI